MARAAVAAKPETNGAATLQQLPLELIELGTNIRIDPGELAELAASIRELGVLSPVDAVGPDPAGKYRLVWGSRRLMASQIAGVATIPAIVRQTSEANAPGARRAIEQLAENLQRKALNDMEEADALAAVLEAATPDEIALAEAETERAITWILDKPTGPLQ